MENVCNLMIVIITLHVLELRFFSLLLFNVILSQPLLLIAYPLFLTMNEGKTNTVEALKCCDVFFFHPIVYLYHPPLSSSESLVLLFLFSSMFVYFSFIHLCLFHVSPTPPSSSPFSPLPLVDENQSFTLNNVPRVSIS